MQTLMTLHKVLRSAVRFLGGQLGLTLLAAGLLILGSLAPAQAFQPTPTIIIAPLPNQDMSRPRGPLSEFVTEALYDALLEEDYAVYEPDTLAVNGYAGLFNRKGLLQAARKLSRPPMDLMILHKSRVQLKRGPQGPRARLRFLVEVVDVSTGRRIDTIRQDPEYVIRLPRMCDRRCMIEELEPHADRQVDRLIEDVLDILEDHIPDPDPYHDIKNSEVPGLCGMRRGWELTFDSFDPDLMQEVEAYLVAFSCYMSHRPTKSEPGQYVFWYESAISPAHFQRNIQRMADDMGIDVSLRSYGNRYVMAYEGDTLFDKSARQFDGW